VLALALGRHTSVGMCEGEDWDRFRQDVTVV